MTLLNGRIALQQANPQHSSFRFVIIVETHCEACYALSGSADLEHNFPDCNWEQSEWRSKRSAAKHERRVIQLAKSVDTQERQPAADDNCQR